LKPGFSVWLLLGLVGVIGTAPAWLSNYLLADTPFCLIGSRGSLWSGNAWLAGRHGNTANTIMPLSWHWSWNDGPLLELVTPEGTGGIQWGIGKIRADVPPFVADLQTLPLPTTLAGTSPLGRLRGVSGHFECDYRWSCQGQASLRIENLSVALFPADRFGDVDVIIDAAEHSQSARLTADGKSALVGEVVAQRQNGRMTMTSNVQTTSSASSGLMRAIASLKADGTNTLSFGQRWLDGASGSP
jgi:hypothetical protein